MDETRVQVVARTLLQICITILPIGAGASSFISRQEYSLPILTALALVWAGLIAISYCAFLLLKVMQFERGSPRQTEDNKNTFNRGVSIFILGMMLLVLSPAGFAFDQLMPPRHLEMQLSRSTLAVSEDRTSPISRDILLTVENMRETEISESYLWVEVLDKSCIRVRKVNEMRPAAINDTWITRWRVTIQPNCPLGDELLQFKLLKGRQIVKQVDLVISINR